MKNSTLLRFTKNCTLSAFALLFLMSLPSLSATEEISEFWESVRVYSPDSTGEGENVVTQAEEVSEPEVPGGKRAYKLPAQSRTFLRFNPRSDANEPRDLSSAKTIKVRVHATSPATFAIRIAGGGPSLVWNLGEHSGAGWELLELHLDEKSNTADGQNKHNNLSEITLIDFLVTGEVLGNEDFFVADLVAE